MLENILTNIVVLATAFSLITQGIKNLEEIKEKKQRPHDRENSS
ncbi:hypothetical protein [Metabacillus fastidiosus]